MKKKIAKSFLRCCVAVLLSIQAMAFSDVSQGAWYADAVRYVEKIGLMGGIGDDRFDPNGTVSRGMLVTVLFRMDGASAAGSETPFSDVKKGSYYEDAVAWAAANGIVIGYSSTRFGPDDNITREQFATILYRYANYDGGAGESEGDLSRYSDYSKISAYAIPAMKWANESGLIEGTSSTTLAPGKTTTRAQMAAIIMRYLKMQPDDSDDSQDGQRGQQVNDSQSASTEKESISKDSQPQLIVSSTEAEKGKKAAVRVIVENNPGILGMTFSVSYDSEALTLTNTENGDALNGILTFMPARNLKSGSNFVWYGTEVDPTQIKDGCVLELFFDVKGTAEGTYPVKITASKGNIIDTNLQPVDILVTNGVITIE